MKKEEIVDVPLIYPLVAVAFRSVSIINGNKVMHECETLLDLTSVNKFTDSVKRTAIDYKNYVRAVIEAAETQQVSDAVERIRGTQQPGQWRSPEGPPLSQETPAPIDQGKTLEGTPGPEVPDTASL